jgi:hypothetical protein
MDVNNYQYVVKIRNIKDNLVLLVGVEFFCPVGFDFVGINEGPVFQLWLT